MEYMRNEAPRLATSRAYRPSQARNPMARCFRCHKTIRKAEVVRRMYEDRGLLAKVTLHEACASLPVFLEVTEERERLADRQREEADKAHAERKAAYEEAQRRARDEAMTVCRRSLEDDTHGHRPCRAPYCPVKPPFVWVAPSDYEYARWKDRSGHHKCTRCGGVAEEEHFSDECHRCSDWGGCGRNCTLSGVRCTKCGTFDPR